VPTCAARTSRRPRPTSASAARPSPVHSSRPTLASCSSSTRPTPSTRVAASAPATASSPVREHAFYICSRHIRTKVVFFSLGCLRILLSISVFSFSRFSTFLILVPCGRLSTLKGNGREGKRRREGRDNNNKNKRLSMLIQRFNSALITDSFCFADEDPDL